MFSGHVARCLVPFWWLSLSGSKAPAVEQNAMPVEAGRNMLAGFHFNAYYSGTDKEHFIALHFGQHAAYLLGKIRPRGCSFIPQCPWETGDQQRDHV